VKRWAPTVALTLLAFAVILSAQGREHVTVHLKWHHGAQFAGLYAAIEEGFFDRADLDVALIDGAATDEVLVDLARGSFDFVLSHPSRHLAAVARGVPIVAVAAIYQIDPAVIFALPESGIRVPEDLIGKRVMSFATSLVVPAVLGRVGLSVEDVEIGPPSFDLGELYSGAYDAWTGYVTNEVRRVRSEGHDVHVIYPTDYGVHLFGDVLVTRRALIDANPDLVARFVDATLDGWIWVLDHMEAAAEMCSRWSPGSDPVEQLEVLRASLPFVHAGELGLGGMSDPRWGDMVTMMVDVGLLPAGFDPAAAYTLQFVREFYLNAP